MYVIEPSYWRYMTIREVSVLAIHALTAAKERVDGVGGKIHFIAIKTNGSVSPVMEHDIETSEQCVLTYRKQCAELLLDIGNVDLSDDEFDKRMASFSEEVGFVRASWKGGAALWKHLDGWFSRTMELTPPSPQSTRADPTHETPSPELPEAKSES